MRYFRVSYLTPQSWYKFEVKFQTQESVFPRDLERLAASRDLVKISAGWVGFRGSACK